MTYSQIIFNIFLLEYKSNGAITLGFQWLFTRELIIIVFQVISAEGWNHSDEIILYNFRTIVQEKRRNQEAIMQSHALT